MTTNFWTSISCYKQDIFVRGYKSDGIPFHTEVTGFCPTSYYRSDDGPYRSIDGTNLRLTTHDSIMSARKWRKDQKSPYGDVNPIHEYIANNYPNEVHWNPSFPKYAFVDIEVMADKGFPKAEEATSEITLITVKVRGEKEFITFGTVDFDPELCEEFVQYHRCNKEEEILISFVDWWTYHCPDILSGWFLDIFDLPYLVNRIRKVLGDRIAKSLSPFNVIEKRNAHLFGGRKFETYDIAGVTVLDGLALFKRFGITRFGNQESYSLDHIANLILGIGKLNYSEYDTIHDFYLSDPQKYTEYNIRDCGLVERIEDVTGYISIVYALAHKAKCAPEEATGTVAMWDAMCYNFLREKNLIVPPKKVKKLPVIEGAYVKEPAPGMYDWIVSFDLVSLYPSLMVEYNISPETIVGQQSIEGNIESCIEKLKCLDTHEPWHYNDNLVITTRGDGFKTTIEGFVPALVSKMFDERAQIKKRMLDVKQKIADSKEEGEKKKLELERIGLDARQNAIKVAMNSFYGAMSNDWFRFADPRMAESVTLSGQLAIRWAEYVVNESMNSLFKTRGKNYIVAADTDSLFVQMKEVVAQCNLFDADPQVIANMLSMFSEEYIEPVLDKAMMRLHKVMGTKKQVLKFKREKICERAIWTGKKKYALSVIDDEGVRYLEPVISVTGLESVRSTTPAPARSVIKDAIRLGFQDNEQEVRRFMKEKKKWFKNLSVEEIARPSGITDIEHWKGPKGTCLSGTPIHVRAAMVYNRLLVEKGLENKYLFINSGDKMKYVYLRNPNPSKEHVVGFVTKLPPEFGLHDFVDRETQCEKTLVSPVQSVFDVCGWSVAGGGTLEDFG